MRFSRKFQVIVINDNHKILKTIAEGDYKQCKLGLLKEMAHIHEDFFTSNFLIVFKTENRFFDCLHYSELKAMYEFTRKTPNAFDFFLDLRFIYGEWVFSHTCPKTMMNDLNTEMQKVKDDPSVDSVRLIENFDELNPDTVLRGRTVKEWEEKQKEYDRQRLELINKRTKL